MPLRLRVRYNRPQDLLRDNEEQFKHGGLLVRVQPPSELGLYDTVEIEIETLGRSAIFDAQVGQILDGLGVAVLFPPAEVERLVEAATRSGQMLGPAPDHSLLRVSGRRTTSAGRTTEGDREYDGDTFSRWKNATRMQRLQLALHGNKTARSLALRDVTNKQLPLFVLRNPNLGVDEVQSIAKATEVTGEVLQAIAEHREWAHRPEIAMALVRNPKTPIPTAIALIRHVDIGECRRLAKDNNTRAAIKGAANKRILLGG